MTKNTLFTIFICSILLSGSFFAISSSLNFSPFVFAQEQQAESTTDPPADTSTTDPPADTSTTDPPADTSTDPSIVTLQHDDVEINQPVQWTATVDVADPQQTIAVEVPSDAQNTLVMNSDGQIVEASIISDPSLLDTSTDVAEITDPQVMEENVETDLVVVDEPSQILNIEFETSAPYTEEAELVTEDSYQKTVTVKSDSELHYSNVKSYSDLPEDLVASGVEFKLYWMIDGVKTDVTSDPRFAVEFVDSDGNGIVDKMQWIVPQLSEQVFLIEGIIPATNAQHLDSNRNFVADVFDQVKERDGIWTDPIPVGDYIRVTFERQLTSENDITIYARSSSNSVVEVYEKNSDVLLTSFADVSEDNKYQIFLTNLQGTKDTFDLKIVGAPVEFDHIIDPSVN